MIKRILLGIVLFGSCVLDASNVKASPSPMETKPMWQAYGYAGVTFPMVSAGVAFRDRDFSKEINFKASTIGFSSILSVTASKIFKSRKNFTTEGQYTGCYLEIGAGGAFIVSDIYLIDPFIPAACIPAYFGYQGKLAFIELGADIMFSDFIKRTDFLINLIPLPTLRFGSRLRF